ncbi:hypothetical protein BGZ81_000528 [Podila clonocystis]|nr:hypothetical protein BGZ81_000528 [Podila clonocystis]
MNTVAKPERNPSSTTTNLSTSINHHTDTRPAKMTPPSLYSKFGPTSSASTSSIFHTRSRNNSGYPLLYSSLSSSYDAFFTDSVTGASFMAPYDDVHDAIDDGSEQERIVFDTHSAHDEHEQYRQQYQRQWSCEPGLSEPTILASHHHQQPQYSSHQRQFSTHKLYHHEPPPSLEQVHRHHTLQQIQVHEPTRDAWSEQGLHRNSYGAEEEDSDDKSEEDDEEGEEEDNNDFEMHQDLEDATTHSIDTSGSVSTHLSLPSLTSASSLSTTLSGSSLSSNGPPSVQAHAPSHEGTHHHSTNFISESQFLQLADEYLLSLSPKKREKALLSNAMYQKILMVLLQPKNTQVSTAQFRFWAKKMFTLSTTATHHLVCHGGKPVATKECLYDVLVYCHRKSAHGGRDKTSAEVEKEAQKERFSLIVF